MWLGLADCDSFDRGKSFFSFFYHKIMLDVSELKIVKVCESSSVNFAKEGITH